MKIININSFQEWIEWRYGGIGGSDAPSVMDSSPFMTKQELWALKTERMMPQKSNPRMRRGRDLEPIARKEYEKMADIQMIPMCAENEKHPFLLASLDGVNLEMKRALEIKCPGREDHAKALSGKIPHKYIWQLVHTLMVTGLPTIDYFSFDGERGVIIPFQRNLSLEKILVSEEMKFWECVLRDTKPAVTKPKCGPVKGNFRERYKQIVEQRRNK